jgi:DHA1 family multidrug resistance protein-like MFS transporter
VVGVGMGGIIPSVSALLAGYSKPGEEGSVYGLDNSIQAAARSLAPLLGSGVALWFGIRGTFVVAGFFFLLALFLAIWKLSEPEAVSATAISEVQTQQW